MHPLKMLSLPNRSVHSWYIWHRSWWKALNLSAKLWTALDRKLQEVVQGYMILTNPFLKWMKTCFDRIRICQSDILVHLAGSQWLLSKMLALSLSLQRMNWDLRLKLVELWCMGSLWMWRGHLLMEMESKHFDHYWISSWCRKWNLEGLMQMTSNL